MPGGIHPSLLVEGTWPVANFVDPPRHGPGVAILMAVLTTLAFLAVCLRLWVRLHMQGNGGLDDICIVLALIPTIATSTVLCLSTQKFGFNTHLWNLKISELVKGRMMVIATDSLYVISTGLTKISIMLFYRRMASGTVSTGFLKAVHFSIGFVIAYMIIFQFTIWFGCRPTNALWNQVDPSWAFEHEGTYSCDSELASVLAACIISVIQDFIACGLPSVLFWKLHMTKRQKIVLGSVFAVGIFICICGVIRIVFIVRLYTSTYDITWEAEPVWYLTGIEVNLAIICASAPALKVFFQRFSGFSVISKWSSYFQGGTTAVGSGSGGNTGSRSDRASKNRKIHWSWSDRKTDDTEEPESEIPLAPFAREKGPGRYNGGRNSPGPNDLPLEGVVVTTEVKTSISSPRRIVSFDSQDSSRAPLQELLKPGIVYAGNYRRGKNL